MTSISDRLRNPKFKFTAPQIQPNLNNNIYDYNPTQIKNFELSRANYLDEDYKDGNKTKEFTPDRVKVSEDTGFSNISGVSFNKDPFASFFRMKTELVPDRHLDGYYQYNLKGMTDNKFIKDRMLQEGGNVNQLEALIRDKAEFEELLEQRRNIEESKQ